MRCVGVSMTKHLRTQAIGIDPGVVHHAICRVEFTGFLYKNGVVEHELVKMPQFKILNWELWNLQRNIDYIGDGGAKLKREEDTTDTVRCDEIETLRNRLLTRVNRRQWLHESYECREDPREVRYPALVTELQCGYQKQPNKITQNVYVLSQLLPALVIQADVLRAAPQVGDIPPERSVTSGLRKYGIPINGQKDYEQRKNTSVEITKTLLTQHGGSQTKWLNFLEEVKKTQAKDGFTRKVDDLTDAFLLALYRCISLYEDSADEQPLLQLQPLETSPLPTHRGVENGRSTPSKRAQEKTPSFPSDDSSQEESGVLQTPQRALKQKKTTRTKKQQPLRSSVVEPLLLHGDDEVTQSRQIERVLLLSEDSGQEESRSRKRKRQTPVAKRTDQKQQPPQQQQQKTASRTTGSNKKPKT